MPSQPPAEPQLARTFRGEGPFTALAAARAALEAVGFSVGSIQRSAPSGIMFGRYDIAKWRNLRTADRVALRGILTGEDKRRGPVVVTLLPACPPAAVAAFRAHAAATEAA